MAMYPQLITTLIWLYHTPSHARTIHVHDYTLKCTIAFTVTAVSLISTTHWHRKPYENSSSTISKKTLCQTTST